MSIPSLSSTHSLSVSGVAATRHALAQKARHDPAASRTTTDTSADSTNALALAIAGAVTQLGFAPAARDATSEDETATSAAALAPLPQQPKAVQQLQQYKNLAATHSNLAQALSASVGSASSASSGSSDLTKVFENLWSSLGSSQDTSADSSSNTMPSLPTFLQALAQNFSESGVGGLRGVFVNTVA